MTTLVSVGNLCFIDGEAVSGSSSTLVLLVFHLVITGIFISIDLIFFWGKGAFHIAGFLNNFRAHLKY